MPKDRITPKVFYARDLCKDVHLASSLSKPIRGKIPVRILNIKDTPATIRWKDQNSVNADEHYILENSLATDKPHVSNRCAFNANRKTFRPSSESEYKR